jgi:hypothetical protein
MSGKNLTGFTAMEREKTEELLRKYYDGLTSSEEEARLRELLDASEADDVFATDRILLSAGNTGVPEPSAEFMSNLEAVTLQVVHSGVRRRPYRYALSIAAGIALLLGSYFIFSTVTDSEPYDTFSDPELAMAEVRNILLNVSQNMNTGTGALSTISTMSVLPGAMNEMGRTVRSVDRSLSRLRYLNDLNPAGDEKNKNNE